MASNQKKNQKEINIELIIQKTANETVKALERNKFIKGDAITYFQKTERLLYNYKDLLKALEQKELDIKEIEKYGVFGKSKSIVLYSSSGSKSEGDKYIDIIEGYKESRDRTARLIDKIKRALDCIKDDPYYDLIEAKYFMKMENSEIEKKFNVTDRTIRRNKNRIINKLKVVLFGADGLEELE